MFSIFKQRRELLEENRLLKMRLEWESAMSDQYLGAISAYRSAIHKLHMDGVINEEQFKSFFAEVEKYQNKQQA